MNYSIHMQNLKKLIANIQTFVVGGHVRDGLLDYPSKDIDFVVVGATPNLMSELGFKRVGADFPVFLDDDGHEYALARTERKTGRGYHGFETKFDPTVTIEDDLLRRDLTINAMARKVIGWDGYKAKLSDKIIDPYGGQVDLENRILRHVSPHFAEDPVRVLRVARFAARYGFRVADTTLMFMMKMVFSGELDSLTEERVWVETEKAIMEDNPATYFDLLDQCDAFQAVMPQLDGYDFWYTRPLTYAAQVTNLSMIERFCILTAALNEQDCVAFYEQLKAPNNVSRSAIKINRILPFMYNNIDLTAEQMMEIFNRIDAFRDNDIMTIIVNTLTAIDFDINADRLLQAYLIADAVSFSDLTKEQQRTLKGPEISKAIEDVRTKKIDNLINKE